MAKASGNILVVDDDEYVLLSIRLLLEPSFHVVETTNTPERLPAILRTQSIDVILLDMNFRQGDTSSKEGLFWLRKILKEYPDTQVILMTAYADIQLAVEAVKDGALDFIVKPWQNEKLVASVKTALIVSQEKKKVKQLKTQQKGIIAAFGKSYEPLIGNAPSIVTIRRTIEKVAPTDAEVLILGENGTGKEVIAREIHRQSHRSEGIFMSVDIGSLSETLFESELFGHRKGAFTDAKEDRIGRFEAAAGGTIFLDEIGNLSLSLQAKLLTVLQRKEIVRLGTNEPVPIDVRVICATNSDLKKMIRENKFREDLYYRINTVEIHVPPLFERPEDIPTLVDHFIKRFSEKYHKSGHTVDASALDQLKKYRWPGNIRELQHAVERAIILSDSQVIGLHDFGTLEKEFTGEAIFDHLNLEKLEAWAIRKAIAKHHGNISHAAEELGLSRGAIYRRIEKYGI
jgi:two-component system, NtrC family, response regulator HydG